MESPRSARTADRSISRSRTARGSRGGSAGGNAAAHSARDKEDEGRILQTKWKHRSIIDAARELFLEKGFAGTSMDEVAALARVSKQTVYKHFVDKQTLFAEFISADIAHVDPSVHPLVERMPDTDDLDRDLCEFARQHLANVMQPELLRMRRVLIGEAERFPELANAWYQNGPVRSCELFAGWFDALHERGLLDVPDPMLAAQHFNWLVLSIPLNAAMAGRIDRPLHTAAQLDAFADAGVRTFLAAFGSRT